MTESLIKFIRETFNQDEGFIPLHEPRFFGNEKKYVLDAIESTFVSSVGQYVDRFEQMMGEITGSKYAIATVNGTNSLHLALVLSGVKENDEVISQPLTFIATANAICYANAVPLFLDVNKETMGLCPIKLASYLKDNTEMKNGQCYNQSTGRKISACIPMHTFGLPTHIDKIAAICEQYNITLIEDSAESLGSYYKQKHTGTFGKIGVFSFNGNKTVTAGGGGALVTDDPAIAKRAKHLSTQAKMPHKWNYEHDEIGYNYRMPNLNAALACAQLEQLNSYVSNKRELSNLYVSFFSKQTEAQYVNEIAEAKSNFWLNAIILKDRAARDAFLTKTNEAGIMTRPIWTLMNKLKMFKACPTGDLSNSEWLEDRVVNITSSVRING